MQDLKATIKDVVSKEFQLPISPSHKKFLKVNMLTVKTLDNYCCLDRL